jgi:hypothetical protein
MATRFLLVGCANSILCKKAHCIRDDEQEYSQGGGGRREIEDNWLSKWTRQLYEVDGNLATRL